MERVEVEAGKTLVVNGPASISLIEGKASILGYNMSPKRLIVVRSWRSRPVYVEEDSTFECTCGEGGGLEVIEGDTVPMEWRKAVLEIGKSEKRAVVSVYGSADSGKTSLATLAANTLASSSGAIYLDLDVGQSSICPPTTIGYVFLKRAVPDVSVLRAEDGEVVGYTSPTPLASKHVEATRRLLRRAVKRRGETHVISDFDGWASGEGAVSHKLMLLDILKSTHLLSIGALPNGLREFCEENGVEFRELPPPLKVRKREPGARKRLREMCYERFLRKSTVRRLQASWVELRDIGGEERPRQVLDRALKLAAAYIEESGLVVDAEGPELLEELAKERVGVLSYVYGLDDRFAGIGLLMALNPSKNYLKIYTPFQAQIKRLVVGSIILSASGEELYSTPPPPARPH